MCSANYAPLRNSHQFAKIKNTHGVGPKLCDYQKGRVRFGCLVDKVIIRLKLVSIKKELIRTKTLEVSILQRRASATSCSMLTRKLLFLEQKPRRHLCFSLVILTDELDNPFGLVLPPDPEEVNRDPTEDDGKANGTFLRCHPEGNSNEKQAGQDEENGQADIHLNRGPKNRLEAVPGEQCMLSSQVYLAVQPREGRSSRSPTDTCMDSAPVCPSALNKGSMALNWHGEGTDLCSALPQSWRKQT